MKISTSVYVLMFPSGIKLKQKKRYSRKGWNSQENWTPLPVLAGGVAHQFNNALAAIVGNIELYEIAAKTANEYSRFIKPIKETAYRMADLTEQLLDYARGTEFKPKKHIVN